MEYLIKTLEEFPLCQNDIILRNIVYFRSELWRDLKFGASHKWNVNIVVPKCGPHFGVGGDSPAPEGPRAPRPCYSARWPTLICRHFFGVVSNPGIAYSGGIPRNHESHEPDKPCGVQSTSNHGVIIGCLHVEAIKSQHENFQSSIRNIRGVSGVMDFKDNLKFCSLVQRIRILCEGSPYTLSPHLNYISAVKVRKVREYPI